MNLTRMLFRNILCTLLVHGTLRGSRRLGNSANTKIIFQKNHFEGAFLLKIEVLRHLDLCFACSALLALSHDSLAILLGFGQPRTDRPSRRLRTAAIGAALGPGTFLAFADLPGRAWVPVIEVSVAQLLENLLSCQRARAALVNSAKLVL